MPGTGSAGPAASVRPSRLVSPKKSAGSKTSSGHGERKKPISRIGSANSVASTSNRSEAAGLITDLMSLKEITHDERIARHALPHRQAIEPDDPNFFDIQDGHFLTEAPVPIDEPLAEQTHKSSKRYREGEDGEESDLEELEDVFGDDVSNVSSIGSNHEDDPEKYDTDLEEEALDTVIPTRPAISDNSPKARYLQICEDMGIQPATYYIKHMSDTELVMKFHGLGPHGMKAMAQSLEINTILEKIDLEGNYILGEGTAHLTRVLRENVYVTELVLTDNKMGNDGAKAICELLGENRTILHLNLTGNDIDDGAAEFFFEMLTRNTSVKTIMLRHNSFEEKGAEWFSLALNENVTLETLDLSWNHFQTKGCVMIAQALKENVGLKYFDFSMNGFGLEGCKALEETLKENKYMLKLNLSYCRIPLEGTPYLAAGLQANDTLEELNIGYNPLTAEGGHTILVGVERNTANVLKLVNFGNLMVRKAFADLREQLQEEREIKIICGGVLSDAPRGKKKGEEDPMTKLMNDPMNKLKRYVEEAGYRMIDLLKSFDRDNSFTISLEELKDGVNRCGIDLTDPEIGELMNRLDKDGNGEIDFSELLEGDNENRMARREAKKLMEEIQQKESEREKLVAGADAKSFMTILEGKG